MPQACGTADNWAPKISLQGHTVVLNNMGGVAGAAQFLQNFRPSQNSQKSTVFEELLFLHLT